MISIHLSELLEREVEGSIVYAPRFHKRPGGMRQDFRRFDITCMLFQCSYDLYELLVSGLSLVVITPREPLELL